MTHLGSYETVDRRLMRLRSAVDSTVQSMGDTVSDAVDLEARRRTMEDGLRRFREVEQRQQPPARKVAPLIGEPTATPTPAVSNVIAESRRRAALLTPLVPAEPTGPSGPALALQGLERARTQVTAPIAAAGLQIAESPIGSVIPGVAQLKELGRKVEDIGVPEGISPLPRTRTFKETFEGGMVNPVAAALGSEEEQQKAQAVLEEAGLPRSLAAEIILDPLNAVPGLGFVRLKDFGRLLRVATTATGAGKARALNTLRNSDVMQQAFRGVRKAPEAGGPPLRGGEELSIPQRIHKIHNRLARDWDLERLGPEVLNPEDVAPIAKQRVIAEFGEDPTVVLFRGIGVDERPPVFGMRKGAGEFWSTDVNRAAGFARGGKMFRVEVKASELVNPVGTPSPVGLRATKAGDEFVLPLEIQNRATEIPVGPLRGGEEVPLRLPEELGRDIPDPVARTVEPEPVLGGFEEPPPPGAPPPSITDGLTGEPTTPGGLLARFQDRLPGRPVQQSDWAKYAGGLAEEGAEIEKVAMPRLNQAARRVPKIGNKLLSRTRNPHNEAMLKALHGEGPVPEGAQGFLDELQDFKVLHEQRTIGDVPSFEKKMLPQYYPRGWKNATEKIDEFRLGQALERGEISPEIFKQQHAKLVGTGRLGPGAKPGSLRTRRLPLTFSEAIEQGWEPLSWNPVDLMVLHAAELADYRYSTVLGELWKVEGRAIPKSAAPTAWKTPDYPAFTSKPFVDKGKAVMGEPLVVSPEDFSLLENMLGSRPTDVTDALAYVTSVFKRAKVALGLFQHIDLNYRLVIRGITRGELEWMAAGPKAMAANFAPPLRPRLMKGLLKDPVIKEGIEEGLQLTGGLDVFKREMRVALEPDLVVRAPVIGDLPLERLPGGVRQGAKKVQDVFNAIYGYMGRGLFDGAQPQYMAAFYKSVRKELFRAHPELTSRQIAALAAETSNNMMSNIPQWGSALGPRLRQLGRATSFSINEGESWLWKQTSKAVIKGKTPGVRGTYLRQWAGYMFGTLAIAEIINYGITGELLGPDQMTPIVMKNGRPTYNNRFARPRLDGDGPLGSRLGIKGGAIKDEDGNITGYRHVYLDLMGQADTPFRALNPQFFIMTRLSPQLSTGVQLLQEEKFFGQQPLGGPGGKAQFAAQQLVEPIPVSAFTQERGRIGMVGAGIQAGGVNVSAEGLREILARTRAQVMQEQGILGDYETLKATDSPRATEVDNDPRVQAIFNEVQKSTTKMAPTPEGRFFEEQEISRGQQEEAQLEDDANLNSGRWSGDVWRDEYRDRQRDFFNRRESLKQAFKVEFEEKEAPSGSVNAAIAAYFDVDVDSFPDLRNPGETDWDGFFKARDTALKGLSADDRRRVMKFIRKFDTPTVTQFRGAQDIVDRFYETPKYKGLSVKEGEELDEFVNVSVGDFQRDMLRRTGRELSRVVAMILAAKELGIPSKILRFAMLFRKQRIRDVFLDPRRDEMLQANQDILAKFYPDLLERQLSREEEAALGEEAFAGISR